MGAGLKIKLKKRQRESLQKLKWKKNSTLAERAQYLLLLDEGKKVSEIAEQLGVPGPSPFYFTNSQTII